MIVCQCMGLTDGDLCRLIRSGVSSIDEITRTCGAGRNCPPCREAIAAMLGRADDRQSTIEPGERSLVG